MGQDPSQRWRRLSTLKPEAVPTIFQQVPQPKASTQHKHSTDFRHKQHVQTYWQYVTKIVCVYD